MDEKNGTQTRVSSTNKRRRKPKSHGWGRKRKRTHIYNTCTTHAVTDAAIVSPDEKAHAPSITESAKLNSDLIPTATTNASYMAYRTIMCKPEEGPPVGWRTLPWKSFVRPSFLPPLSHFSKLFLPKYILNKMLQGDVIEVDLHMMAVSHKGSKPRDRTRQDKYNVYNEEQHFLTVRVPYCCLEHVLLPFDEKEISTPPSHSVGTLPIKTSGQDWRFGSPVNDDPRLEGYELCIDSYGARYFKKDGQKYYLLADYLPLKSIVAALVHSGRTNHFVHSWSYNCQLKHNLMKQRGILIPPKEHFEDDVVKEKNRLRNEHLKKIKSENDMKACMDEIETLVHDLMIAIEVEGAPKRRERSSWKSWNVFSKVNRSPAEQDFCNSLLTEALDFERLGDGDRKAHFRRYGDGDRKAHFVSSMEKFHYLLIMVSSQMMQDEKLHKQYLRLVHGRAGLNQMIAPFKRISFFECYKHFSKCYEEYSVGHKKAEGLMAMLYAMSDYWHGEMPEKRNMLLALPHVASKKAAVTLNACGRYHGIGAGADTHCFKCCRYIGQMCSVDTKNMDGYIEQVFRGLPVAAGMNAK